MIASIRGGHQARRAKPLLKDSAVESPHTLAEIFRDHGLKVTPQRQCIFEILSAYPEHPTAELVYDIAKERMPMISLKTVYETLHSLADLGQIKQIDLGTGSVRFDPDVHHHQHLVCSNCGRVENVELDLDPMARNAAKGHGFLVGHTEVIIRGLCANCA